MTMQRFIRILLVFLVFAVVFHPNTSILAASKTVVLKGAELKGSVSRFKKPSRYISVFPQRIDGKLFPGFFKNNFKEGVPPGNHEIQMSIAFSLKFFDGNYEGHATVKATLAGGKKYETVGSIEDRTVNVWIAEAVTRKRVSNTVSFVVKDCIRAMGLCLF
jgi:hypothetical protein